MQVWAVLTYGTALTEVTHALRATFRPIDVWRKPWCDALLACRQTGVAIHKL
jgi:hypothetical protein